MSHTDARPGWAPDQPQRLASVPDDSIDPATRESLAVYWPPYNIHRVLANNPLTLRKWISFGIHINRHGTLDPRLHELVILRVAWNARSHYEWGQHARKFVRLGFPEEQLRQVAIGPGYKGWNDIERALLSGVDQMMTTHGISDEVYVVLKAHLPPEQLIDYVLLASQFALIANVVNVFRIELDPGLPPMPVLDTD